MLLVDTNVLVFAKARFGVAQFHVFEVHTVVWLDTAESPGGR